MRTQCPKSGGDQNLFFLDYVTPTKFDNNYFKNLLAYKGLLSSDEILLTKNQESAELVKLYAERNDLFFEQFAKSMIKMGNISPLTGSRGNIRSNCRVINTWWSSNISLLYKNHTWKLHMNYIFMFTFFPWWVDYLESIASVSTLGILALDNILVYVCLMKLLYLIPSFIEKLLFFHSPQSTTWGNWFLLNIILLFRIEFRILYLFLFLLLQQDIQNYVVFNMFTEVFNMDLVQRRTLFSFSKI